MVTPRRLFGALAVLCVQGIVASVGQCEGPSGTSQIVVYLEVPADCSAEIVLTPSDLRLLGDSGEHPLPLLIPTLSTTDLLGRQSRLAEGTVEPGRYQALELSLGRVSGVVGRASVERDAPLDPIRIDLALDVAEGDAGLVLLRWEPHAIEEGSGPYLPRIEQAGVEAPSLAALAFVSNEASGNVSFVDYRAGRVVGVLPVGEGPRGLAYSAREQRLYVAVSGAGCIAVIDVLARRVIQTAPMRFGDEPTRLLLSRDEQTLYVLNHGSSVLTVLTAASLQEISRIPVGERPRSMAEDPLSGRLYVASELAGEIFVYEPIGLSSQPAVYEEESAPGELLYDSSGRRLIVSSVTQRRVSVIDPGTGAVVSRLNVCSPAVGLAYNPVTRRLYAALAECREIVITRPERGIQMGSIRLDTSPGLMSFDSGYRQLLVTLPALGQVAVYNANSGRRDCLIDVGLQPHSVVVP